MAPTPISLDSVVRASADQTSADLGDAVAVLQMRSGLYFGLDGVATEIWQAVREPVRVADLRDYLLELYDVDADVCEHDLVAFLGALADEGLLTTVEE